MWMKPPRVYDVTNPNSHNTSRITKMVQSMAFSRAAREQVPGHCGIRPGPRRAGRNGTRGKLVRNPVLDRVLNHGLLERARALRAELVAFDSHGGALVVGADDAAVDH